MFYTVFNFCLFSIIKVTVICWEISGYSAYSFEWSIFWSFMTVTARTFIIYNTGISTYRIAVNWMVYCTLTYTVFFHTTNNLLESFQISCRISIHFDVWYMTSVCKCMVWSFNLYLIERSDVIINGNLSHPMFPCILNSSFNDEGIDYIITIHCSVLCRYTSELWISHKTYSTFSHTTCGFW